MTIQVQSCNAETFLQLAKEFLFKDPVKNGLLLSIAQKVAVNVSVYGTKKPSFLILQSKEHRVLGVALRTPPYPWSVSEMEQEVSDCLISFWNSHKLSVPGFTGPKATIQRLTKAQEKCFGVVGQVRMNLRLYSLQKVLIQSDGKGTLRLCEESDLEQVHKWAKAFAVDAHLPEGPPTEKQTLDRIKGKLVFLWEVEGQSKCMIAYSSESIGGVVRIGPVYTPKAFRKNGCGTNATAALSQHLLNAGSEYCSLFTDLANPTSNKIYQNIGYRPVTDFLQMSFEQESS